ncbi:MAG TPA: hypothetical protein VGQ33_15525 [Vicinamibacteria bacterium]|nr:hypothetical protein [Vicinamibacteria bacterium]
MLAHYLSAEALSTSGFRLGLALAAVLLLALIARRPRPRLALAVVIAMHLAAWLAYRAPLQRPYGLGEGSDRSFNVGMAAAVATGHSPFEHTQVRHGSPEPLWNEGVALLAGFEPRRVPAVWDLLTPAVILAVGLATYVWIRRRETGDDAWLGVLTAFSVLSLSSLAMNPRPPARPFWVANFLYKPNHGLAYAFIAAAVGLSSGGDRVWPLALALSGLAWVFLPAWAYALVGLVAGVALRPAAERRWRPVLTAIGISVLAAAPYVAHLARDYAPTQSSVTARHMWNDPNALLLAVPNWSTIDLGPLLTLGLAGLWLARHRGSRLEAAILGLGLAGWAMWLASLPLAFVGFAPEPDDLHFLLRYVMSLAAGYALARGARALDAASGLGEGRAALLVLAGCLPLAFPVYHDPLLMDPYYAESCRPIPPKILAYAEWIRTETPKDAVFAAGKSPAMWIPALSGRRVLLAEAGKLLPGDYAERKAVERTLLTTTDAAAARAAAARYGITHLAIDDDLVHEYGADTFAGLASAPWDKTVFANTAARIVELRW